MLFVLTCAHRPHPHSIHTDSPVVRAPLPSRRDVLMDDMHVKAVHQKDPFRDFKKEQTSWSASSGLSELFKPPRELIFQGSFDEVGCCVWEE